MRKDPYSMSIPLDEFPGPLLVSHEQLTERFRKENPKVGGFIDSVQIRIANGLLEVTFVIVNE